MLATVGPATTGPGPNDAAILVSTVCPVAPSVGPASSTTKRAPCTPISTGRPTRAARLRTS